MKNFKRNIRTMMLVLSGMLILGLSQADAQRGKSAYNCYQNIPNLTEKQQDQIDELRREHFNEMDDLRAERRATRNYDDKSDIREEMLKMREEHREDIRALLNKEQKEYFDNNTRQFRNCHDRYRSDRGRKGTGRGQRGQNRNW